MSGVIWASSYGRCTENRQGDDFFFFSLIAKGTTSSELDVIWPVCPKPDPVAGVIRRVDNAASPLFQLEHVSLSVGYVRLETRR